jgi:hypothetical protein
MISQGATVVRGRSPRPCREPAGPTARSVSGLHTPAVGPRRPPRRRPRKSAEGDLGGGPGRRPWAASGGGDGWHSSTSRPIWPPRIASRLPPLRPAGLPSGLASCRSAGIPTCRPASLPFCRHPDLSPSAARGQRPADTSGPGSARTVQGGLFVPLAPRAADLGLWPNPAGQPTTLGAGLKRNTGPKAGGTAEKGRKPGPKKIGKAPAHSKDGDLSNRRPCGKASPKGGNLTCRPRPSAWPGRTTMAEPLRLRRERAVSRRACRPARGSLGWPWPMALGLLGSREVELEPAGCRAWGRAYPIPPRDPGVSLLPKGFGVLAIPRAKVA